MEKPFFKRWWLWAIVAWIVWGIYVQIDMNGSTLTENNMEHMMGSGIILVIVVVVIYRLFNPRKKKNKNEFQVMGPNILAKISAHHVDGLPLSEKTFCELILTSEKLNIVGGGTTFSIMIPQLRAAELKTDTEIENILQSSGLKGIAGARVIEKKSYTHCLILNYINSVGELAAIMFEVEDADEIHALEAVFELKSLIINNPAVTIQL